MNHWLKVRENRRRFDVVISMGGQRAKLSEVRLTLREGINSAEIHIDTDRQNADQLSAFYLILGDIFIDLSSFTEPDEAMIAVVPNDETKDGYTLTGAIALTTNFHEVTTPTGEQEITVEVSFSYGAKRPLPYISI